MFEGFTDKTIEFLWGIRFNNNREWMAANKETFQKELQQPMRELGREVYDFLRETYPQDPVNLHVSRIYRDARRLFGRGPLKENMWFELSEENHRNGESPAFWFEIDGDGYRYGMGCYCSQQNFMEKVREQLEEAPAPMRALQEQLDRQERFAVEGESYKKPKPCSHDELRHWYQYKSFSISCRRPHDAMEQSRALVDELKDAYRFLMPFYEYFNQIYKRAE